MLAAGTGSRFGDTKQFLDLRGSSVLRRSLNTARSVSGGVVVVVPPGESAGGSVLGDANVPEADVVVSGGRTRVESARAGIGAVPDEAGVILVHDAARPLAGEELFSRVVEAVVGGSVAVVPAVAVSDTIRTVRGEVVDRDDLRAVQTPQGFRADVLREAHDVARASGDAPAATDDASLVQRLGMPITMIEGESTNMKITDPQDLAIAAAILEHAPMADPDSEGPG